jgi:wyosine [tRNA(Phe)-imidazoG37] synthetase (radical SAM superfamily)
MFLDSLLDDMRSENHVFGPVPSRRLGRSLGVDVVSFKTCTFDCIYCQLGRTTNKTIERREWVPLEEVVDELRGKLTSGPDYVTIGGSGEPTLYSRIGELIDRIRSITDIPIAVLTNGSLLWKQDVRNDLRKAHVVIPSLDVGENVLFQAVNRPHPAITFERLLDGLASFRQEFQGQYWLEVLLLAGYTAIEADVKKIAKRSAEIGPDRVQLNTCVRPPAEEFAYAVDRRRLIELAGFFTPPAEVIADFKPVLSRTTQTVGTGEIFQMLQRRPCTALDIAAGLGMHPARVLKDIERSVLEGLVEVKRADDERIYYVLSRRDSVGACQRTGKVKKKT